MIKVLVLIAMFFNCITKVQCNDIEVNYKERNDTLVITFINTGNDTLHLFSTYFSSPYIYSKVLHKVDVKNKMYKVSFLPLLPFLSGYLTDRIVLSEVKITMPGQNRYSFIEILPKSKIEIEFPLDQLFANVDQKNNAVKDFDNNAFKRKDLKEITLNKQKGEFELFFEFAFYKEINLLIDRDLYIMSGISTYEQSKEYTILTFPVTLEKEIPLRLK